MGDTVSNRIGGERWLRRNGEKGRWAEEALAEVEHGLASASGVLEEIESREGQEVSESI